uniref:SCP domain-containing protein n=1 Tax=Setaria digitata TaxID=48799 RepID=A0A915PIH6_9BILA
MLLICNGCHIAPVLLSLKSNAMLYFLSILLLASFGTSNIIEKENSRRIEIIVQKYKALGASEIDKIKNERYDFRFCACGNETEEPEGNRGCSCSTVVTGQTTLNSVPQALLNYISLSSILVTDSKQTYLPAVVRSDKTERWPDNSLRKLAFSEADTEDFDSSFASYYTRSARVSSRFDLSVLAILNAGLSETSARQGQLAVNHIDSAQIFIQIAKIRKRLLESAKKHHLLPSQFNVAVYKDAIGVFGVLRNGIENEIAELICVRLPVTDGSLLALCVLCQSTVSMCVNERCVTWLGKALIIYLGMTNAKWIFPLSSTLVIRHNVYRSRHGVGLLKTNSELERTAELWAQSLANKAECLIHDPSKRFGENLFYFATDFLPDEETLALMTVQSFYLEAHGYDYKTHHHLDYHRTGHFTQLVWKSTTQMGVGVAMRHFNGRRANSCQPSFPSTLIYVVVKYDPPGNDFNYGIVGILYEQLPFHSKATFSATVSHFEKAQQTAVRIVGFWSSRNGRFSILAKFGFQQIDPLDTQHSSGFVYGNVSSRTVNEARGALLVVPAIFINGFLNEAAVKQSCDSLLQNISSLAFETNCLPKGKGDVLRWIPCPIGKLCIEEDNPEKVVNGSQMTLRIEEPSTPQYWYLILVACYLDTHCLWKSSVEEVVVHYDLWLTNGSPFMRYLNPFSHQFSFEEQGVLFARFLGETARLMSTCLLCLLLILLSCGWSFGNNSDILVQSKFFVDDVLHDIDLFKSWPGYTMIAVRLLQALWFLVQIRRLINEESDEQKAIFLAHFGAGFLVWFVYILGLGIIASFVSALWRFKMILVITTTANFAAVVCLVHLFWSTSSHRRFFLADIASHRRFNLANENEGDDFESLLISDSADVDTESLVSGVLDNI